MLKSLLRLTTLYFITISFVAHSRVVVDSTRHLYKEGAREISANIENKDDTPYLIKSWVEAPEGTKDSFFMVTPPLFRLEGKQTNTVRVFPNAYISKAPKDRETVYFFNVMSIPPTSDSEADKNKLQLAVRHRMRLIYRPRAIQDMNITTEAKNLQWRKSGNKITLKNPTPFFIYFKTITINGRDITSSVNNIDAFSSKEFTLPAGINGSEIVWKVATDNGGSGPANTASI